MAEVSLRGIGKVFPDGTAAVTDLSLDIRDGEFIVLVGPSGCGKSTVLRLLAGLEEVTRGEVRIGGRVVNDFPPQARNIAMVFQNYALYPHMTVRGNLAFPLRMMKVPRAERAARVEEIAELLGLTPWLDRRPRQLSGGQRQRVAMGRAMVRKPAVFLLDEPLSNLDARLRVQVRAEIARLQKRLETTTVYVTHDQVEAMTLGDRVAVLRDGRLQQVGHGPELHRRPANTFVAGFIGSPGMNVFHTRLLEHPGGGLGLAFGERRLALPGGAVAGPSRLAGRIGEPLLAGLRPEAFAPAPGDRDAWRARVVATEALGHEHILYLESPVRMLAEEDGLPADDEGSAGAGARGGEMAARIPAEGPPPAAGDEVALRIDASKLVLFDRHGVALASASV